MKTHLTVVNVEDRPEDSELLTAMLAEHFEIELVRVDSAPEFERMLERSNIDIIISDFTLPSYTGMMALTAARSRRPEIPFIFLSGTIGEEAAVETLTNGATDYVLKHKPQKLLAAIDRALREKAERESRVAAELALKRREEWFRKLIENALDIISILDRDGNFTYNSPSLERVLGYRPEEVAGLNVLTLAHPSDVQEAQSVLQTILDEPDETVTAEFRIRHKNGTWKHLEFIGKCLVDEENLGSIVVNSRDVSDRHEAEQRFLRAQRMECLGVLASGIAHDLNNILAPIVMGADLLKNHVTGSEALRMLETIQESSQRGSEIVKQVLSFARGVKGEASSLDLRRLIREVVKLLRETFPKSIQIQTHFGTNLTPVLGNATELHQLLMNLCVNARDAMPDGGLLQISAKNVPDANEGSLAGEFVCLTVRDSGMGIPTEDLEKIFEPFYTTKEEGKGTGLGLPTVLSIVKRHGGFIKVDSVLNEGTEFNLFLPPHRTETDRIERRAAAVRSGMGEVILLVDDETAVQQLAKAILEDANYKVVVAHDGVQALQAFRKAPEKWDLIITDISMPIMDGVTLIKELRSVIPDLRIICTTGESSRTKTSRLEETAVDRVLNKPYTAVQFLTAVSEVLASRPKSPR
jgi:two-component system, cell cycle sensor histidine kinase and response regulator CckA